MELILILIGIAIAIAAISKIFSAFERARKYDKIKPQLDNLNEKERQLAQNAITFRKDMECKKREWNIKVDNDKQAIKLLCRQKSMGFPWLANAYANYFALEDKKLEEHLKSKKRPAYKAAEAVKEASLRRREAERNYRVSKYKIEYYENLFPWLTDLIAEDEEDDFLVRTSFESDKNDDVAKKWLTPEEYAKLPNNKKYQLALDRYVSKKKTKWEIGRDYERFIGYVWEKEGYRVTYQGIIDGFEDLGRDLIARRNNEVDVIQCKYWAKYKLIHEKHIFQLFGTTMELWLKNNNGRSSTPKSLIEFANLLYDKKIRPVFVTSTNLSEMAKKMSTTLNVVVYENYPMKDYPRIKCNVSTINKEKIYHLPFDQQYDKIAIEPEKGEFYAKTIMEAERAKFRRAFRWRGSK